MVTWLHLWIMSMLSMGFGVTDMVTNGYIGYKLIFCCDFPILVKKKGALNIISLHIFRPKKVGSI